MNGQTKTATFTLPIVVSHLRTGVSITLDMLVDTSKIYPRIPASILRGIGVEPTRSEVVELLHGTWLTIDQGEVHITVEGLSTPVPCVFGPEQEPPTLGWLVLESLSLKVDEEKHQLVPVVRRWVEHG